MNFFVTIKFWPNLTPSFFHKSDPDDMGGLFNMTNKSKAVAEGIGRLNK